MVFWTIGSSNAAASSSSSALPKSALPAGAEPSLRPPAPTNALPVDHPDIGIPIGSAAQAAQCPVDHTVRHKYLQAQPSESPFQASAPSSSSSHASQPPPQFGRLSAQREISSIPRATKSESSHLGSSEGAGNDSNPNWVYPSEQQFYNAMARKNHNPQERDMKSVVPIHNAVNERAWEQILMWEVGMGSEKCGGPRLISFAGKPTERTPKAWFNVAMGYTAPFDRHDWIVDRCGKQVRYVIDFYTGKTDPGRPMNMAFYLDVRPALDNYDGIETRLKGWAKQWLG